MSDAYQWWLTALGRTVVWAGLREMPAGTAQVIDSDGNLLAYDSVDSARASLLDADFTELAGMDDSDLESLGLLYEELRIPQGDSPDDLHPQLVQQLPRARQ